MTTDSPFGGDGQTISFNVHRSSYSRPDKSEMVLFMVTPGLGLVEIEERYTNGRGYSYHFEHKDLLALAECITARLGPKGDLRLLREPDEE
jgi:hypothetical protein